MIPWIAARLATRAGKAVAIALAATFIIVIVLVYLRSIEKKGEAAGANKVIVETQRETIETQKERQREREKINEEVRTTPYGDRVKQLD